MATEWPSARECGVRTATAAAIGLFRYASNPSRAAQARASPVLPTCGRHRHLTEARIGDPAGVRRTQVHQGGGRERTGQALGHLLIIGLRRPNDHAAGACPVMCLNRSQPDQPHSPGTTLVRRYSKCR
ncbi:hypothetical protein SSP24_29290 [Streptomyces spinoverrucosus]|uniref:Uncharacterized protein n=1 Tax=Streptomyces spinoverrucosus TaxID=284043 RepID=A0A4Y3VEG4_9ACTN|nr:hypothetical protein SSP24_29290 [Streptomyces spinoverrucosus]GHB79455.1 hypothetical protein GCM10010397_57750 [Streptomyces spinoverrucosus]